MRTWHALGHSAELETDSSSGIGSIDIYWTSVRKDLATQFCRAKDAPFPRVLDQRHLRDEFDLRAMTSGSLATLAISDWRQKHLLSATYLSNSQRQWRVNKTHFSILKSRFLGHWSYWSYEVPQRFPRGPLCNRSMNLWNSAPSCRQRLSKGRLASSKMMGKEEY